MCQVKILRINVQLSFKMRTLKQIFLVLSLNLAFTQC
uniref:Uncharacterized protein n=1 Tax=Arundo donax TaxID=35708 RepID=A0A0A9C5F9_ARUDO